MVYYPTRSRGLALTWSMRRDTTRAQYVARRGKVLLGCLELRDITLLVCQTLRCERVTGKLINNVLDRQTEYRHYSYRSLRTDWDTILGTRRAKEKDTRAHDSVHVPRRRTCCDASKEVRPTVIGAMRQGLRQRESSVPPKDMLGHVERHVLHRSCRSLYR